MRRAVAVGVLAAGLAGLWAPALPAAAATPARLRVHHWRAHGNVRGVTLYGTWTRGKTRATISGRMRDTRKDGRWVRVTIEGRSRSGKVLADSYFLFNGGRRAYTSPAYRHSESPSPRHGFARACVLRHLKGFKVLACGHWHRVF
jgi:hypothetical protein